MTPVRKPVAVFMDKGIDALKSFMGILYSGCFYTLVDPSFPATRINQILNILEAELVITDQAHIETLNKKVTI